MQQMKNINDQKDLEAIGKLEKYKLQSANEDSQKKELFSDKIRKEAERMVMR